ncbi:hypothetical protein OROGR_018309 [Orobanche gracilis]
MTVKGGTSPACAVCKYQRRRCSPNCPLAPYFPSDQTKTFRNVHRLFGVSNVTKILDSLNTDDQKEDAMKSIIYEAEMRQRFPVHGCSMIVCQLRSQLHCAIEELRRIHAHIAAFKEQSNSNSSSSNNRNHQLGYDCGPSTQMDVGPSFQIQSDQNGVMYGVNPDFLNEYGDFYDQCPDVMINDDDDSNNLTAIQAQMSAFGIHQDERSDVFFNDFKGMDDRRSYVVTKADMESSEVAFLGHVRSTLTFSLSSASKSSMKETITAEKISKSDLKNAAAGFTLTTIR